MTRSRHSMRPQLALWDAFAEVINIHFSVAILLDPFVRLRGQRATGPECKPW